MPSLESSLNGNFNSLFGEVVTYDIYEVRTVADIVSVNDPNYVHWKGHAGINFVPDTVLDLGANVGIFTRYAHELWPNAQIISVEPNEGNHAVFEEHTPKTPKIILLKNAIGSGQMYHCNRALNGAHEVYLSKGIGYNQLAFDSLKQSGDVVTSAVNPIMLTDLKKYIKGKVVCKLDIEGNETVIFNDPASMEMMKTFDYIAIELHYFASDGSVLEAVKAKTAEALASLNKTHHTRYDHIYFYATKKN